jgi:hypothetical protein
MGRKTSRIALRFARGARDVCLLVLAAALAVGNALGEPMEKRVVIVANKSWEAAPLMDVLLEPAACPPNLPRPAFLNHPLRETNPVEPVPRAVFKFHSIPGAKVNSIVSVEIWCIQDLMNPKVSSSSSKEKARILPGIFHWDGKMPPDLVIAFGTAAFPGGHSRNGSVVIASASFVYDPFKDDLQRPGYWHSTNVEHVLPVSDAVLKFPVSTMIRSIENPAETRFITPPLNPDRHPAITADLNYAAVSVINITNYADYSWADQKALGVFEGVAKAGRLPLRVGSLETTHGLIRLIAASECPQSPFLFVSGITDRVGHFDEDVSPRTYAQNFTCAHNAGITTAWLLPELARQLGEATR